MNPNLQGLKNDFKTAMVNESSVFNPLKFYCTMMNSYLLFLTFTGSVLLDWTSDLLSILFFELSIFDFVTVPFCDSFLSLCLGLTVFL